MIGLNNLGKRICIIGCSSSGKSTLADALAKKLKIPVVHLDFLAHFSHSNWQRKPDEALIAEHDAIIQTEQWVIDGNYSVCMPERLARATAIIWLDSNVALAAIRYIKRCLVANSKRIGKLPGSQIEFQFWLLKHIILTYPKNRKKYQTLFSQQNITKLKICSMKELNDCYRAWALAMENQQNPFGLPIEYQQLPEYFDAHNINKETMKKNAFIESLLKTHSVKRVLDMTCGTGSQVFYLTNKGYDVIGSDFSPALLSIARQKALKMKQSIIFVDGDMRTIKLGQFDAVITIFNAIGHLSKVDFEKTLENVANNLKENGLYIFDIFNLQAINDKVLEDFAMKINRVVDGANILNVQHSELDKENGLLISYEKYKITDNEQEPQIKTNVFSLQIYTAEEIQQMLEQNGFKIVEQYDMQGNMFIPYKSLSMLTVARKKCAGN